MPPRRDPPQTRPGNERETPLGLPRGVFLCRLCDANTPRRLSSGVFRLCFCFSAVVIRFSDKCHLKSTLRGFSTFAAERLSGDSGGRNDSRGGTPTPTLRLPDSQRLPATPRLPATLRLPTSDPRGGCAHPCGGRRMIPRAAIPRNAPRSRPEHRNAARPQ